MCVYICSNCLCFLSITLKCLFDPLISMLFWLGKDTAWNNLNPIMWLIFVVPTVIIAVDFVAVTLANEATTTTYVSSCSSSCFFFVCLLFTNVYLFHLFCLCWEKKAEIVCGPCACYRAVDLGVCKSGVGGGRDIRPESRLPLLPDCPVSVFNLTSSFFFCCYCSSSFSFNFQFYETKNEIWQAIFV